MIAFAVLLPYVLSFLLSQTVGQGVDNSSVVLSDTELETRPVVARRQGIRPMRIRDKRYGERNVSWFELAGNAIIDGDIVYGTIDELRASDIKRNPQLQGSRSFLIGAANVHIPWPGGVITYKYESDATFAGLSTKVDASIARWLAVAPYLTFKRINPNSSPGVTGVVTVRMPDCGGCSATVGHGPTGTGLVLNLQAFCGATSTVCSTGSATHEMGHVIGLHHEQQRPDRPAFVNFHCENVEPGCPSGTTMPAGMTCCDAGYPTGCCSALGAFTFLSTSEYAYGSVYDASSIMHYGAGSYAKSGTNTMSPAAPGVVIAFRTEDATPTDLDGDGVCKLYRTLCPRAIACDAYNCPASCTIIGQCSIAACSGSNKPPCCNPVAANAACMQKKSICAPLNCGFLGPVWKGIDGST